MAWIDKFLTPAQRQAGEWMRVPRTGPQWGDDVEDCNRDPCEKHKRCHCMCPCMPDGDDNCEDCADL